MLKSLSFFNKMFFSLNNMSYKSTKIGSYNCGREEGKVFEDVERSRTYNCNVGTHRESSENTFGEL